MRILFFFFLTSASLAVLPTAAPAQTRKPAPKPAAKPAPKPVARPATKAAPATAPRAAAPAPAPAPAATPAATQNARAASGGANPFEVGTNALNLGIGLGSRYGYGSGLLGGSSSVTPALSIAYERGILPLGPGVLGVGGIIGYQAASYDYSGYKDKFTDLIVMVRGAFHYPVTPQFDAYGGVGLGLRHLGYSSNYTGLYAQNLGLTGVTSGLFVGGRYYFTSSIGAFAELGYDQTYLKAGLALKF